MRIFKNTIFDRFASKEGISDEELKALVTDLEEGNWEADLGSGVYKKRFARPGQGKSGGYRVIVFFKSDARTFFAYGFAKSARGNISKKELKAMKEDSKETLAMTDEQLQARLQRGRWIEITSEETKK